MQRFKPSNLPDNVNIVKRSHINLGLKLSIACRFGDGRAHQIGDVGSLTASLLPFA